MSKDGEKNTWYVTILKLLKLELASPSGRINLGGMVLLLAFCVLYTAQDAVRHFISATEDIIKSVVLKADIYHPYETDSVFEAVIPFLIGMGLCLLFLYFDMNKKQKLQNEQGSKETKKSNDE